MPKISKKQVGELAAIKLLGIPDGASCLNCQYRYIDYGTDSEKIKKKAPKDTGIPWNGGGYFCAVNEPANFYKGYFPRNWIADSLGTKQPYCLRYKSSEFGGIFMAVNDPPGIATKDVTFRSTIDDEVLEAIDTHRRKRGIVK